MAKEFSDDFGPVELPEPDKKVDEMDKDELKLCTTDVTAAKALVREGYNPVNEKIHTL